MTIFALLLSTASAAEPVPLTVEVLTEANRPVTTATIEVEGEGEVHRVHGETALWTATGIVPPDRVERPFEPKQLVHVSIAAEGYEPVSVAYVLRRKKNHVRVILHEEAKE